MSLLDEIRRGLAAGRQAMLSALGLVEDAPGVALIESYAKEQAQTFLRSVVAEVLAGAAVAPPVSVAGFVELLLTSLDEAERLYVAHHAAALAAVAGDPPAAA